MVDYIQVKDAKTGRYKVINKKTKRVVFKKLSDGPYKNIPIKSKK